MKSLTLDAEQLARVEAALKEANPVRVTLAFEKQPEKGAVFREVSTCVHWGELDPHEATFLLSHDDMTQSVPLPMNIDAKIVVRKVCDECNERTKDALSGRPWRCGKCDDSFTIDTDLRLTTGEEPWVGSVKDWCVEFEKKSDNFLWIGFGDSIANPASFVASYLCDVSRKETEGCNSAS